MMRSFVFAVAAALLTSTVCVADLPKVGDVAPDFEMKGSDGKSYKLADFAGKKAVIVAWYPRAFTGGCTKECKSFRTAGPKLKEFEVAYFTASTDDVQKNADFAKSLDLDYTILCDPESKAAKAYGVLRPDGKTANRVTFVIGANGKVLAVDDKVVTDTHADDLAGKLAQLGVAKKQVK